jgi:hypothetical protein
VSGELDVGPARVEGANRWELSNGGEAAVDIRRSIPGHMSDKVLKHIS